MDVIAKDQIVLETNIPSIDRQYLKFVFFSLFLNKFLILMTLFSLMRESFTSFHSHSCFLFVNYLSVEDVFFSSDNY